MNLPRTLPLLALSALLAFALPAHAQVHEHEHHDTGHATALQVPADHVPWAPDAPLREGMARIRHALHELGNGRLGTTEVIAQAGEIDAAIAYLFANCKLDPEPDATLHHILAQLMNANRALHANPSSSAPLTDMQAAVQHYAALFDDPETAHRH